MKKKTWKTIAALTLTAGLMLQPVSAVYAAEGEWAVEEAGEVITEDVRSEDYGAADEPVRGLSNHAQATSLQLAPGLCQLLQLADTLDNILRLSVQYLALHIVLLQEGEDFHGGSQ